MARGYLTPHLKWHTFLLMQQQSPLYSLINTAAVSYALNGILSFCENALQFKTDTKQWQQ